MILLTKTIKARLIANHKKHKQAWNDDHPNYVESKIVVKLFNPTGIGRWWLTELDPETNIAFGLCQLHYNELGYASMEKIESIKVGFGLKIERDKLFESNKYTLKEIQDEENKKMGLS